MGKRGKPIVYFDVKHTRHREYMRKWLGEKRERERLENEG